MVRKKSLAPNSGINVRARRVGFAIGGTFRRKQLRERLPFRIGNRDGDILLVRVNKREQVCKLGAPPKRVADAGAVLLRRVDFAEF